MICSTSLTVRSARAINSKLPTIARPICANASFSTSSKSQTQQPKAVTTCLKTITRPSISLPKASVRLTIRSSPSTAIRHNSTAASPSAASAPASSPSSPNEPLTWNRFLALRKIRRRISLVASIVCGVAGSGAGFALLATTNMESMGAQMSGLDPMVILGLGAVGCGTIGWLMGPFFGGTIFTLFWRGARGGFAEKEHEFYKRIKKYRVDPTASSMNNPVPDYYGEKICSVKDYRRWLKDQRAFNLKRGIGAKET